jgi:predicted ArsR family transcriptional regulator
MNTDPDLASVALLDEPMRRALYDWVVAQHRPVGREEAAGALGITRALATFHLDRLAAGGLLDADYRRLNARRGPGAGRPARVYWRSDRELTVSLPMRRYELAARTLAEALEADPAAATDAARTAGFAAGTRLGERIRREHGRRSPMSTLRLALAEQGYEPDAPDGWGVIRLRNCPFHALVDGHRPLVCGMNLAMAEGLSDAIGERLPVRPVLDPQPGRCCVAFVERTRRAHTDPR